MAKEKTVQLLIMFKLLDSVSQKTNTRCKTKERLKRREQLGYFKNIIQELRMENTGGFKEMMRMDYEKFKHVLNLIEVDITPDVIVGGNKAVSAPERFALTLRFLSTGETFKSLSFQFHIWDCAISY